MRHWSTAATPLRSLLVLMALGLTALGAPVRPAGALAASSGGHGAARAAKASAPAASGVGAPAPSACPAAHCSPQLGDDEPGVLIPTHGVKVAWTFNGNLANRGALGCSVGVKFAVCTGGNPSKTTPKKQPYVYAFNPATGKVVWNSGLVLNGSVVGGGGAYIDAAHNTYLDDDKHLVSFDPTGKLRWEVANPAKAPLSNFAYINAGYLVGLARQNPLMFAIDPANGHVVSTLNLVDTLHGIPGIFGTQNKISAQGNRIYAVTSFYPDASQVSAAKVRRIDAYFQKMQSRPGRLYSVEFAQGALKVAWHWDFAGPSGASPTVLTDGPYPTIYTDGKGVNFGDQRDPWLFAVQDQGDHPVLLWSDDMTQLYGIHSEKGIVSSPAHDPRGGVWDWVYGNTHLFRFDEQTGKVLQIIDVSALLNLDGYGPGSVQSTAVNGGHPIMFLGTRHYNHITDASYLTAIDLVNGTLIWKLEQPGGDVPHMFVCQFPIASTSAGLFIVAQRWDGIIYGLHLY